MTNVQLYFAIGVPTFTMLCSLVISIWQLNQVMNQVNLRFTSLEGRFNSLESRLTGMETKFEHRFNTLEGDLKTLVRVTNDLDVRLARLEERTAR